ncbi:MAG TPA: LamG domain-containing protein [Candidatus Limnocylindrales bacterium]|nr:LamG domain-containing protein [Candidatus Limnocylindrales bacterium]
MKIKGLHGSWLTFLSFLVSTISIPIHSFAQNSNCVPLPAGMIGWWRGEGDASDSFGTNNGAPVNNPGFMSAKVGQGFWFSDYNQRISVPDSPSLDSTNEMTLECWILQTSFGQVGQWLVTPIVEKGDATSLGFGLPSPDLQYYIGLTNTMSYDPDHWFFQVGVRLSSGIAIATGSTAVQVGIWHHVAMTYDGANLKLYVNGNQEGSAGATGSLIPSSASLDIGGHGVPYAVPCIVDELSLYNRALASNEVQAIFQAGSAGKCHGSTPPAVPACVPPPTGLVGWWQAETNAFDSIGDNDGTASGVSYIPGKVGNAFYFPNSPYSSVAVPNAPDVNLTNNISIEGWVYPLGFPPGTFAPIVEKGIRTTPPPGAYRFLMRSISGVWHFDAIVWTIPPSPLSPQEVIGARVIQTNTWYHIAMTYDGTAVKLYVDGELDGSVTANGPINSITDSLVIGSEGSGYFFIGLMDEIAIYDRALTATEIKAIYAADSGGKCANVLHLSASPGNLSVSWPLSARGFQLESTYRDPTDTNSWSQAASNLQTNGGRIQIAVPMSGNKGFFRLRHQ